MGNQRSERKENGKRRWEIKIVGEKKKVTRSVLGRIGNLGG